MISAIDCLYCTAGNQVRTIMQLGPFRTNCRGQISPGGATGTSSNRPLGRPLYIYYFPRMFATREHPAGAFGAVCLDSVLLQKARFSIYTNCTIFRIIAHVTAVGICRLSPISLLDQSVSRNADNPTQVADQLQCDELERLLVFP